MFKKFWTWLSGHKSIDPTKNLFELRIFRLTMFFICILGIILYLIILIKSDLCWNWDLSYNGFNNFIQYFKFPLGVLALLIPTVALIASIHRSEQTKKQIELTTLQSNFSNHFKHKEEFGKYLKNYTSNFPNKYVKFISHQTLHNTIFVNSKYGDFVGSLNNILDDYEILLKTIVSFYKKNDSQVPTSINSFCKNWGGFKLYMLNRMTKEQEERDYTDIEIKLTEINSILLYSMDFDITYTHSYFIDTVASKIRKFTETLYKTKMIDINIIEDILKQFSEYKDLKQS